MTGDRQNLLNQVAALQRLNLKMEVENEWLKADRDQLRALMQQLTRALEAIKSHGSHSATDEGISTDYLVEVALTTAKPHLALLTDVKEKP